jgi:hypothetical protein
VTAGPGGATATCACKPPRIGPPASTSTTLATAAKQAYRLIPPEVATIDDGAVPAIGEERVGWPDRRDTRFRDGTQLVSDGDGAALCVPDQTLGPDPVVRVETRTFTISTVHTGRVVNLHRCEARPRLPERRLRSSPVKSRTATCFCGCGLGWLVGAERWLDSTNEHGWHVTDALSSLEADLGREDMVELRDADTERFLVAGHEFRDGQEHAMHRSRRSGVYDLAGVRAWLREAEYRRTVLDEVRDRMPLPESARTALAEVRMARWTEPWIER